MCPFSPSITASRFQADLGKLAMTSLTMRAFGAPLTTRGASLGRPPVCSAGPSTSGRWVHTRVLAETESRVEAAMGLDRFPQPRRVPVDFISCHPSHRHPLLPGMVQHGHGLLRLGGKADILRHAPLCSPGPIRGPCFRQVEFSVQEHVSIFARVAQDGGYLAVL